MFQAVGGILSGAARFSGVSELFSNLPIVDSIMGMASSAAELGIQKAGDLLGLDQRVIDVAQGSAAFALGDGSSAFDNFVEALTGGEGRPESGKNESFGMGDLSAQNREDLQKVIDETGDKLAKLMIDIFDRYYKGDENGKKVNGERGKDADGCEGGMPVGNFFEALAMALGEMLGEKAGNLAKSANDLQHAGGDVINPETGEAFTAEEMKDKENATLYTDAAQKNAQEFSKAQARFQSDSQVYGQMSEVTSNVIKTIGQALSSLASKN